MEDPLLSIIGHTVNTLTFAGVMIYTIFYRRRLRRTTVNTNILIIAIIAMGLVFAVFNGLRLATEIV